MEVASVAAAVVAVAAEVEVSVVAAVPPRWKPEKTRRWEWRVRRWVWMRGQ